jgi:hypothetical protein
MQEEERRAAMTSIDEYRRWAKEAREQAALAPERDIQKALLNIARHWDLLGDERDRVEKLKAVSA